MARVVTVVFSDGRDRGVPEMLGVEMARLRHLAPRVVWGNPLNASPSLASLARDGRGPALGGRLPVWSLDSGA